MYCFYEKRIAEIYNPAGLNCFMGDGIMTVQQIDISENANMSVLLSGLPFVYDSIHLEVGHRPIGFRFVKHIFNITAKLNQHEFIVCGEDDDLELARAKVFSELMERSALIEFGSNYKATNSNGWAAHPDRTQARLNAIYELVERDAVLAQWYSSTAFLELEQSQWPLEIQHWAKSELAISEFPQMRILLSTLGLGPSVTVLFLNDKGFGVSTHATKATLIESIKSAITEACRPAHASIRHEHWKDSLKLKTGQGDLTAADAHAVYYAYQEPFPVWIFGEKLNWNTALKIWDEKITALKQIENKFEYTVVMEAPISVGFAKHPESFQLSWGCTNADWVSSQSGWKRLEIDSNKINKQVHIVS